MTHFPPFISSGAEIIEYAIWLGMDPVKEKELLWIAAEGIKVTGIAHSFWSQEQRQLSAAARPLIVEVDCCRLL